MNLRLAIIIIIIINFDNWLIERLQRLQPPNPSKSSPFVLLFRLRLPKIWSSFHLIVCLFAEFPVIFVGNLSRFFYQHHQKFTISPNLFLPSIRFYSLHTHTHIAVFRDSGQTVTLVCLSVYLYVWIAWLSLRSVYLLTSYLFSIHIQLSTLMRESWTKTKKIDWIR